MEPSIKNFSEIEKLIKENPKEADAKAFEWQQFVKTNAATSPEIASFETSDEFYRWVSEHPEKNINPSVWAGKEISEAYYYLRYQHENEQMQQSGNVDSSNVPQELVVLPFLAASFLERPKIMEADKDYQKIEEKLRKDWLKKNNTKDFLSKEGLDYLHGSLDPTKTSLAKEAENIFRSNPKFKKRIERYDKEAKKIYKDHRNDPKWQMQKEKAQLETNARLELLEKNREKIKKTNEGTEILQREITDSVNGKFREEFTQNYPEKAKIYFEKIEAQQRKKGEEKESVNIPQHEFRGGEIRVFETESTPQENPLYTTNPPTGETPSPHLSSERGNRGINVINRFARKGFTNPLGKVGQRIVSQTALRGFAAFLGSTSGVWVPILVTFLFISVFVFIIVFFGAAPPAPQLTVPAEDILTPIPAAP